MGTRYLLIYWRRSETGYVRDENRDGMSCVEPHFGELCIVSDGMGADVQMMVDELVDLALEMEGKTAFTVQMIVIGYRYSQLPGRLSRPRLTGFPIRVVWQVFVRRSA